MGTGARSLGPQKSMAICQEPPFFAEAATPPPPPPSLVTVKTRIGKHNGNM